MEWSRASHYRVHRLPPERRLEIANRIKNHPRWESDFNSKMPDVVKAGDEQVKAEWIFQQSACWPDTVAEHQASRAGWRSAKVFGK